MNDIQDDGIKTNECSDCGVLEGKHCQECSKYTGIGQGDNGEKSNEE